MHNSLIFSIHQRRLIFLEPTFTKTPRATSTSFRQHRQPVTRTAPSQSPVREVRRELEIIMSALGTGRSVIVLGEVGLVPMKKFHHHV